MANERLTAATLALADYRGQRILDVGCGDGTYTVELYDRGGPRFLHGIDPAPAAIGAARQRAGSRAIEFRVGTPTIYPTEWIVSTSPIFAAFCTTSTGPSMPSARRSAWRDRLSSSSRTGTVPF